jgi:hypothetical protein
MKASKIFASMAIAGGLAAGAVGLGTGVANADPGLAPAPADWGPQGPGGPRDHDRDGRRDHDGDRGRGGDGGGWAGDGGGWGGQADWAPPPPPPPAPFDPGSLFGGGGNFCLLGFCLTAP